MWYSKWGRMPNTSEMSEKAEWEVEIANWNAFRFSENSQLYLNEQQKYYSVQRVNDIAQFIKVFCVVFINSERKEEQNNIWLILCITLVFVKCSAYFQKQQFEVATL